MRLIDAEALKAEHCSECSPDIREECKSEPICASMMWIHEAPTIDAVPVVRCKDCKFSGMYCFGISKEPTFACLDIEEDGFVRMATAADPDGYCFRGERRSDDAEE